MTSVQDERHRAVVGAFADLLGDSTAPPTPRFIMMHYADGTGAAGGPWSDQQARRRAALIYRQLPASMFVSVAAEPVLPPGDDASTFMAVASYIGSADGPTRRIVFGWWRSAKAAHEASAAVLDQAPDATSADYAIDVREIRLPGQQLEA